MATPNDVSLNAKSTRALSIRGGANVLTFSVNPAAKLGARFGVVE